MVREFDAALATADGPFRMTSGRRAAAGRRVAPRSALVRVSVRGHCRRPGLAAGMALVLGVGFGSLLAAEAGTDGTSRETVRDRLWVFTCVAGSDNDSLKAGSFPRMSRMTPAESAFYLNVPNLMMIRWRGQPEIPFDQYAIPFRPLRRLVWSLVGSGGETGAEEREATIEFAARCPNLTGFIMDDFFVNSGTGEANLSLKALGELRDQLVVAGTRRDLYVVVYKHQLDPPIQPYLNLCDKITYWTWHARELVDLEKDFTRLEALAPGRPKLLGCYMWDFGEQRPTPLDLMQKQCRVGLEWLHEGRIEGIIFLANTVADLDLPSVEWTRQWIAEVGGQPIRANGSRTAP